MRARRLTGGAPSGARTDTLKVTSRDEKLLPSFGDSTVTTGGVLSSMAGLAGDDAVTVAGAVGIGVGAGVGVAPAPATCSAASMSAVSSNAAITSGR